MSRMVGMTIGLKAKLVMDLERWRRRIAEAAAAPAKDADRRRRAEVKRNVGDILNEVVGKTHGAKEAASVARRINRWFAARDHETLLPDLPLGELVARIAREFGYKIVWSDWGHRHWAAAAEAASPQEAPYTPPEIQRIIIDWVPTEDGGSRWVELGILQPDGSIVPEAPPDAPTAEDAAPVAEQTPPPERPPPVTRDPPLTREQLAEHLRRLATDPNYRPSDYEPL
jgi:hypothetical protein